MSKNHIATVAFATTFLLIGSGWYYEFTASNFQLKGVTHSWELHEGSAAVEHKLGQILDKKLDGLFSRIHGLCSTRGAPPGINASLVTAATMPDRETLLNQRAAASPPESTTPTPGTAPLITTNHATATPTPTVIGAPADTSFIGNYIDNDVLLSSRTEAASVKAIPCDEKGCANEAGQKCRDIDMLMCTVHDIQTLYLYGNTVPPGVVQDHTDELVAPDNDMSAMLRPEWYFERMRRLETIKGRTHVSFSEGKMQFSSDTALYKEILCCPPDGKALFQQQCEANSHIPHSVMVAMLHNATRTMDKYGLYYSMDAGTLLSAMRAGTIHCWENDAELIVSAEPKEAWTKVVADLRHTGLDVDAYALTGIWRNSEDGAIMPDDTESEIYQWSIALMHGGKEGPSCSANLAVPFSEELLGNAVHKHYWEQGGKTNMRWIYDKADWDASVSSGSQMSLHGVWFRTIHRPVKIMERKYGKTWCISKTDCHAGVDLQDDPAECTEGADCSILPKGIIRSDRLPGETLGISTTVNAHS